MNFSRNEIRLLAQALKDLDQRTSGIEKLPDGRTRVGNDLVTGFPSITVDEHNAAAALLQKGAYAAAFKHSKRAIETREASQANATVKSGDLLPESLAKIYHAGAVSAFNLNKYELSLDWIRKSVAAQNNAERTHLLALTLHVLQQNDEASAIVSAGLAQQPDDTKLLGLKKVLDSLTPPNKEPKATGEPEP